MEEKTVAKPTTTEKSGFNLNSIMNTTVIHIIMEVVTICGMGLYFNNKISKQQKTIDDLAQKLVECEENIQRHEEVLEKIVSRLNAGPNRPTMQHESVRKSSPKQRTEEENDTPLPLNLLADIMGVASGSLSNTSYTTVSKDPILPSIEELDSEIESELQDLKEGSKD